MALKLSIQKMKIMVSSSVTSRQIGKSGNRDILFSGAPKITADGDCSHQNKRHLLLGRKTMTNLDSILKNERHYFADKGPSSQGFGFSCGHVWM